MKLTILFATCYYLITAAPFNEYNISGKGDAAISKLYILYPRTKMDKTFYIFFNKKNISKISYGERLEYDCNGDIDMLTVIQETEQYVEPRTAAKNMRNLFLKEGKSYYLQINSKGQLEYIPDATEGEKLLNDNGKYVSALKQLQFTE